MLAIQIILLKILKVKLCLLMAVLSIPFLPLAFMIKAVGHLLDSVYLSEKEVHKLRGSR